jgi:hypothetical protein
VSRDKGEPLAAFSRFSHDGLMAGGAHPSINRTKPFVLAKVD